VVAAPPPDRSRQDIGAEREARRGPAAIDDDPTGGPPDAVSLVRAGTQPPHGERVTTRAVALATDRAYLPWTATAVLSCLRAHGGGVDVHLTHAGDVTAHDLRRLAGMVDREGGRLHPLPVDALSLGRLPSGVLAHGGAVSCARLVLPEALPHLDRLVYLDADTMVRRPLDELWTVPLDGLPLAAVRNVVEPSAADRLRHLGADPERYLNSGVLVMDLARMRELGTSSQLLDVVRREGERLLWVDQDALNLALGAGWLELHPRWNAQNSFWHWAERAERLLGPDAVRAARADPAVVHFEGPWLCKPWHYLCDSPHVGAYRALLRQTPWAGTPLTDRTIVTRGIRRLPARHRTAAFVRLVRTRRLVQRVRTRVSRGGGPTAS